MKRFNSIDVLKTFAIIAVVLYHSGFMQYGYLGVDIFLVVNGYLLANSFNKLNTFKQGFDFLTRRLLRLYPIIIIASIVCLVWGSYWMLPYNFFDLSQYTIATNLSANNILMSIKSSDYWNTLNDYKPLMHTWYLGVVVQFYIFFTILIVFLKKTIKTSKNITLYTIVICSIISLILYLIPLFTVTEKFYFLPFRIFEFGAGMCVALIFQNGIPRLAYNKKLSTSIIAIAYVALITLIILKYDFIPTTIRLLLTVFLSSLILAFLQYVSEKSNFIFSNRVLAIIGRWSFSIYMWHQIVLAFCRYSFTSDINAKIFIILMIITIGLSVLSYYFIEVPVSNAIRNKKQKYVIWPTIILWASVLCVSFYINFRSGVIRDVPELDIFKENAFSRMHIAYNENAHRFDKDFTSKNKLHWLVIGDSYGRDFVNIINEAGISDKVEISYIVRNSYNLSSSNTFNRIDNADKIFFCMSIKPGTGNIEKFIPILDSLGKGTDNLVIVGSKLFGYSCGQIYSHRYAPNYYKSSLKIDDQYFIKNEEYKKRWGENYIDMITPVAVGNNEVKVFSDENKIISQDCEHLTEGGAKYYAKLLNPIFKKMIDNSTNTHKE